MKISSETQSIIKKYYNRFISPSGELISSHQDTVLIILTLQDEYQRNKDPLFKKAIEELRGNRMGI